MSFDCYIISETEIAKTLPLICPHPSDSSKGLGRFLSKSYLKKKSFTLAETLITLTIIGVIAALTVPTLISNYQKHTYVTRLKKAYSQLQNAVKMIPISEGCAAGDYECAGFIISPSELNGSQWREWRQNATVLLAKQFKTVSVNDKNDPNCKGIKKYVSLEAEVEAFPFITEDSMCFVSSFGYYREDLGIYVDINGAQGPNKMGRDIFYFYIASQDKNNISQGTVMPVGSKVLNTYTYVAPTSSGGEPGGFGYWKERSYCTTQYVDNGRSDNMYCTGRVLEEDAMNY